MFEKVKHFAKVYKTQGFRCLKVSNERMKKVFLIWRVVKINN